MKQTLILISQRVLPLLFVLAFTVYAVIEVGHKPRVLVLHSYATGYSWTDNVSIGIRRVLDEYPYEVRWHYMDTKNHSEDNFKQRAARSARAIIGHWSPDVIIAVDDNAQSLVSRHYLNRSDIRIVFAGVGNDPADYFKVNGAYASNVTGILEIMPLDQIQETILMLFHRKKTTDKIRIFCISDASPSAQSNRQQMLNFHWDKRIHLTTRTVTTFDEWKQALKNEEHRQDLLFFTNYHTLAVPGVNPRNRPGYIIRWTLEHIRLPGMGGWGYFVEDGGMLAVGPSPYEQGEWAANAAHQIIQSGAVHPESVGKYQHPGQFLVFMRSTVMKKFNVRLPSIYEAFARATDNCYQ